MSDRGNVFVVGEKYIDDLLRELLERKGYKVESADRSEVAFTTINAIQPNLVILDTKLPDTNPFALCETLKQDRRTFDIPVIFIITDDDADGRVQAVESGDDLITKPLEEREVLARVERQVTVSKVRRALRESEAKFRSVMESAIDAIISSDVSGNIRAWNSAATALFGFSEEEAIGQPIELIIPERFHKPHREGLNRVSTGGPSRVIGTTVELAAVKKDGSEFPVELSLATWFLDDLRYFTGIIRDISERKQAEQKFRSVTESAIDAIISADHKGKIVSWNSAATRILGYTPDEAIGQQIELIIPERFHDAHSEGMARVTAGGESRVIGSTVELFARTKGGEEVPIELSLSTWEVHNDRYYTGIIRDIGERKRAEEELRISEQALRESTLELKNKNEKLELTLNRLQEVQHQLIMQEKMASLGKLSAGMAHELNNPTSAAQSSAVQLRAMFEQLQGAHRKMTELNLSKEQLNSVIALDQDARLREMQPTDLNLITRSDRELEIEDWLEKQNIEKSWELATVFVNLGYDKSKLRLLVQNFSDREFSAIIEWLGCTYAIHSLLSEINLGTSRIADIVNALKTYTYMDQAPIQSVDLNEGLDNTLIIFKNKLKSGIKVIREYAKDLPIIQAYGGELNQVWTNIIDNAIEVLGEEGVLVLRTRVEDPWVIIEIEDSGPGIPEEIQTKIFDPFFTTKPEGEGTGLGLNISHNIIVKKHQGQIYVTSKPGETCFKIKIPIESNPDKKTQGE